MSVRIASLFALLPTVVVLAACGGGGTEQAPGDGQGTGSTPPGEALSIEEALASSASGDLLVQGYVIAPEGEPVRLCSALLESYPPQCGEPSVVVEGLDLTSFDGLTKTDDPSLAQVTWSDMPVSIPGKIVDDVLSTP